MDDNNYTWTKELVIGTALLMLGGSVDSNKQPIKALTYYKVGKRKTDGKVVIIETAKNFKDVALNESLKRTGQLN